MNGKIHQMEPLLPENTAVLGDMAREIVTRSAALTCSLHPTSLQPVIELLRLINSYYSNLIEGHSTHPVDIERAMRKDYDENDPAKRDLQMESLAHIECQRKIDERLQEDADLNVASTDFLCWLHRIFYARVPEGLRLVKDDKTGEKLEVIGGKLREREILVGRHVGPSAGSVPYFLERFADFYRSGSHHGIAPLIAAAASHHRLVWIHPFLDGNGRIARLYTDACFKRLPLAGYGLWNVSRGLARRRDDYMAALTWADAPRRNDVDGRGNLSREGLAKFCKFFFEVCLDQIDYMNDLLRLDALLERIKGYVQLRVTRVAPHPRPELPPLKSEAVYMLQEALLRGEVSRGDMIRISGLKERTGRALLSQLLAERLLASDTPKGPVRLAFPTFVVGYLFPDIYPTQLMPG